MALTKISRGLLNTGLADSSDATAITISSAEKVTVANSLNVSNAAGAPSTIPSMYALIDCLVGLFTRLPVLRFIFIPTQGVNST